MSEVYQAGRFVFVDEPQIAELFYIDYRQKLAKKAASPEQPTPAASEPALA